MMTALAPALISPLLPSLTSSRPSRPTRGAMCWVVGCSPNPADWRCDETGVEENLWLNLSTGFIGSGRKVGYVTGRGAEQRGGDCCTS